MAAFHSRTQFFPIAARMVSSGESAPATKESSPVSNTAFWNEWGVHRSIDHRPDVEMIPQPTISLLSGSNLKKSGLPGHRNESSARREVRSQSFTTRSALTLAALPSAETATAITVFE